MRKAKRYDDGGETDALESANSSEDSQAIENEAKGDTMLKAMRDEAAKPKPVAKPKLKSFIQKPKNPNFTSAETKGGAALTYRKPFRSASTSTSTPSMSKKSSGNTVDFAGTGLGMSKGGSASSRADGCCTKGKTKGKMY